MQRLSPPNDDPSSQIPRISPKDNIYILLLHFFVVLVRSDGDVIQRFALDACEHTLATCIRTGAVSDCKILDTLDNFGGQAMDLDEVVHATHPM